MLLGTQLSPLFYIGLDILDCKLQDALLDNSLELRPLLKQSIIGIGCQQNLVPFKGAEYEYLWMGMKTKITNFCK